MHDSVRTFFKEQIDAQLERSKVSGNPPGNFEILPEISGARYTSDDFYQLEQEHIWGKSWLLAGHADEIPNKGDFVLWERLGVPIIIVRNKENNIRAFYNTCQHRGGPVVAETSGNRRNFRCQYHSWLYSLDGELKHIPDEHDFAGICKKGRGLKRVRCETLGKLIFINRDLNAEPLRDSLGPMVDFLQEIEPDNMKFVCRETYDWAANWKIVVEAFHESYHARHIHPETVFQIQNADGAVITLHAGGHSRNVLPNKPSVDKFELLPPTHPLEEGDEHDVYRSATVVFNMFPNVVIPGSRVRIPVMSVWPIARDRTLLEIMYVTLDENNDPEGEIMKDYIGRFKIILSEDEPNLSWMQRSMETGALESVQLNYQERCIYHFQERLDQLIGTENIPATMRVEPRLGKLEQDAHCNYVHAN